MASIPSASAPATSSTSGNGRDYRGSFAIMTSLTFFIISITTDDPIAKLDYKNGVVIGLLISATGSALFWPAAVTMSYPMFSGALFVVGLGFTMLQIAANPYVTILGSEKTASSRLNLARGFNSIRTTIEPIIAYVYAAFYGAVGHRVGRNNLASEAATWIKSPQ
jgi:FHS family L-fucose permease-like MFS transporter